MRISTRGRYALVVMINLARNYDSDKFVSLKEISEKENISLKYLEKIMLLLNKDKLLVTSRGNVGGYKLAKSPKEYTIFEILKASEGDLKPVSCLNGDELCIKKDKCSVLPFFYELDSVINEFLNSKTLEDLL